MILRFASLLISVEFLRICISLAGTMLIASVFGASAATDAFFLMSILILRIGERFRKCINVSFVPIYAEYKINYGKVEAERMASAFATRMLFFSILFMIGYAAFAPYWLKIVASGFSQETKAIAINIGWILSPIMVLFLGFSICESIFISENNYLIPSLSSIFAALGPLLGILFLTKYLNIYGLTIGTTFGMFISFALPYIFLIRNSSHFSLTLDVGQKGVKKVNETLFPIIVYNILLQLVVLVDRLFATRLGEGFTSTLSYAYNLAMTLPAVVSPSILVATLSTTSEYLAKNDYASFSSVFNKYFKLLSFVGIPFCVLMVLQGDLIVRLLLQRGKFDAVALGNTVIAFKYYNIGVLAYSLWVFVAGFLASLGKVKYLIQASFLFLGISILFNSLLMKWFGYIGLPIATSAVFILQLFYFIAYLNNDSRFHGFKGAFSHFIKVSLIALIMAFVVWGLKRLFITAGEEEIPLLYQLSVIGILTFVGSLFYLVLSKVAKIEGASYILEIPKRFSVKKT